jgi:hypothetical protein
LNTHEAKLISEEKGQVLDLLIDKNEFWVSSTNSNVSSYSSKGIRSIFGRPSVTNFEISDNKKFIVTKDTENAVQVINLLEAKTQIVETGFEETIKKYNNGKNSSSWFSANIRLGCLMVDLSYSESLSVIEPTEKGLLNYGEFFIRQLFYYLILKNSEESEDFAQQKFPFPTSCGYENATIVLSQILAGGIFEPVFSLSPKLITPEEGFKLPMWMQKLIFKQKPSRYE